MLDPNSTHVPADGPVFVTILRDGEKYGPYSFIDIKRHVQTGKVSVADWATYTGHEGLVPLTQIPGLENLGEYVPPPPPTGPSRFAPQTYDSYIAPRRLEEPSDEGAGWLYLAAFIFPCAGVIISGYLHSKGRNQAGQWAFIAAGAGFVVGLLLRSALISR